MKQITTTRKAAVLLAIVAAASALTANAAAPALNGQVVARPLTPQEIKDYSLTGLQGASGLNTVGVGSAVYLECLINNAIAASDITNMTWTLTTRPADSLAALASSPLGANVPTYKPVDRETSQVAGRTLLRPDVSGQYVVSATVGTASAGTANISINITAGNYMGAGSCVYCHSGSATKDVYHPWSQSPHATFFTRAIDGLASDHYGKNCISCHTVGYDANTNAVNGGFDDVATKLGWTFPAVLTNGNWAALPTGLKALANIQCENCHGPVSEHVQAVISPEGTNSFNWPRISVTMASGDCAQCHDSKPNHVRNIEWNASRHAVAVEETEAGCARCHSAKGFANYTAGATAVATEYETITCAACHNPHDASKPHQLRTFSNVTLMDNKTVISTNTAGSGIMCMNCHMSRRDATNYVEVTAGSNRFGPHHGPQADMLAGANAVTYGKVIPSSAHKDVVSDTCSTCHMQTLASTNVAWTHAGGHTFSMSWETGSNKVEVVDACVQCHGPMTSFDLVRQDYDGNGIVQGVQTEVKGLLSKLAIMLPPVGVAKTNHTPTTLGINSSWTKQQLRAGYNYLFVVEDGSWGVHNLAYTVGLLKASIADLNGDANNDGIADWWQNLYFGSPTAANAAPNASPAGDGIPNWLKYSLGLDPTVKGMTVPGGVVWASGTKIGGSTDTVQIFTAAEVAFNTVVGKTYQIQAISNLGGGWVNVGAPIPGTGNAVSYVTPTRQNVQQYYRVLIQ